VTDTLLLDTHIALWLDSGDDRLRAATRSLIDGCWQAGGTLCLSAITMWEIALLVDTGRIELDLPIEEWAKRFLERPGLKSVPLGHRAALRSYQLYHLPHRDPADRLLITTAIELACPLVTYETVFSALARGTAGNTGSPQQHDVPPHRSGGTGERPGQPNLLVRGKPLGTRRPAAPRAPRHGVSSVSVRVRVSPCRHERPSASRNTLASSRQPDL